jgi:hypothetical protein
MNVDHLALNKTRAERESKRGDGVPQRLRAASGPGVLSRIQARSYKACMMLDGDGER